MPPRRRCLLTPTISGGAGTLLALLLPLVCQAIHLDIYVPLPQGCIQYYALLANELLRGTTRRPTAPPEEHVPQPLAPPSEHVDLFSRHTPHVTLYLADFDLETDASTAHDADPAARALNTTKVTSFLGHIAALNFTDIIAGWECPLSLAPDPSTASYFQINGAYVMLPVENTPCLQTLSTTLLHSLQSYLRHPVVVPSWVASLPEPDRSAAIFRTRTYGSPNILERFAPHVTVGFDPAGQATSATQEFGQSSLKRVDTMEQWNDLYRPGHETCVDQVQGIAVGKTGEGGTVLANSKMGAWELKVVGHAEDDGTAPRVRTVMTTTKL